ncbi:unnamed protein product [Tilletia laevis]|uniref:Uncharacterized protein n=2 Tax=Tilletia TaxID=13289 RepID=A0A177UL33_9BASI|nr:hypothetical protein CF336_g5226 [Tilletia laevis]KAE8258082.1 hypothetical protein A4X03_0g4485 [Tilletia caries]KAE8198600.1 hypothetical protein CF335_g4352 [Tilletia laevis]CAD6884680.1 unnamed protein product [Tilletia caries]CAD6920544.1 unnamed protein product [Tilletia caries]
MKLTFSLVLYFLGLATFAVAKNVGASGEEDTHPQPHIPEGGPQSWLPTLHPPPKHVDPQVLPPKQVNPKHKHVPDLRCVNNCVVKKGHSRDYCLPRC